MSDQLRNKKILFVGGSAGLGLAVATMAQGCGAQIVIASRGAAEKHEELVAKVGPEIETFSLDVTSKTGFDHVLQKIKEIDHLVMTTRPTITPASFVETDLEQAQKAFETRFWGQCRLIQKVQGRIRPGGSILLTTGIAGEKVYENNSIMAVLNSATETLCRTLAVEMAPIRVNAVSPGFIAPKPQEVEHYASQFPSGRVASAAEVAEAYIYLMTNQYVTGTTLVVDGGARLI